MERKFYWKDEDDHQAVLCSREPYMEIAVVRLELDKENSRWEVTSRLYNCLNLTEPDIGIPMERIKKRVLVELGKKLGADKQKAEQDLCSLRELLYEGEAEDPYEAQGL